MLFCITVDAFCLCLFCTCLLSELSLRREKNKNLRNFAFIMDSPSSWGVFQSQDHEFKFSPHDSFSVSLEWPEVVYGFTSRNFANEILLWWLFSVSLSTFGWIEPNTCEETFWESNWVYSPRHSQLISAPQLPNMHAGLDLNHRHTTYKLFVEFLWFVKNRTWILIYFVKGVCVWRWFFWSPGEVLGGSLSPFS